MMKRVLVLFNINSFALRLEKRPTPQALIMVSFGIGIVPHQDAQPMDSVQGIGSTIILTRMYLCMTVPCS